MSATDQSSICAALDRAVEVAGKERSQNRVLAFQVLTLRDNPEHALPELRSLLEVLELTPALEGFAHGQSTLGLSGQVSYVYLVQWLLARAQQVGSQETVEDLGRYVRAETLSVSEVLAVDGLCVSQTVAFGDYELVPWSSLPLTDAKWHAGARGMANFDFPSAAVVQRQEVARAHLRPWENYELRSLEPMIDVLRCTAAAAGVGFRLLHYWVEPPAWAPWAVQRMDFGIDRRSPPPSQTVDAAIVPTAQDAVARFTSLEESDTVRFRLPLERLNRSYLARHSPVDAAIDLGIALESLFAPAKLSEGISFAVRTRAARFLGGSIATRNETSRALKDAYDLRSRAIHAGRFDADDTKKWRDHLRVQEALSASQSLVATAVLKMIREGEPDWDEFDLGPAS